ncbi:MAG: FtsX-like permease family protein [Dehalococcoidia bacterium]|jgi:lipoprotein-releasing system permease protein|nr:FtsX-like permease family protein [Dehalococcoidia bacterium]
MSLPLRIAVRFLLSGKTQTLLIVGGIAVAISVQVFVGLLLDSLQKGLVEQTVGNSPQITVTSAGENVTIGRWGEVASIAASRPGVAAVGVAASANAFVKKGNDSVPVLVRGLDDAATADVYHLASQLFEGRLLSGAGEALIGRDLAAELDISVGDRLQVRTTEGAIVDYDVSGLFDLGVAAIDGSWVVTNLRTAQNLFGFGNRVTSIEVSVSDIFAADRIAAEIEALLADDGLDVSNWKDENESLLSAIQSQSISSNMIQSVIIISVAIAIASILSITVLQKRRQVGILKAMGIKDRAASLIFVYQGLLIGLMSGIAGLALGVGLLYGFTTFATTGGESVVDFRFDPAFIVRSFVIAVGASGLAGLAPARRSLRLTPIEVIREG